ncbi:hypothetical protein K491DRAFT_769235 [Lophiostoma macrostomum CBS 122681]|uniref:DUF6594 domain-containing protein n=1 Tax=Lophiostoma macrostomum CBS 122681 TaxID=1314788 RepID=A0A6A6T267_9PLEO|nr:hypothetical protein K491DRAFT_769235 [Lophiostoma macrostomum CBS 122681]
MNARYISGYPALAAFIASDIDQTSAIFKRFKRLGARNLLHLESELAELEAKQDNFDEAELQGKNWQTRSIRYFEDTVGPNDLPSTASHLIHAGEAVFYECHVASLPQPTKPTLQAFRHYFFHGQNSSNYPMLGAHSKSLFDDVDDLVALRAPEDRDRLTAFVQDHLSWAFQSQPSQRGIAYTSDRGIARFVAIVSTINAAALLIGAITSLYTVESPKKKLGIIAAFTMLFAGNVGLLTSARRAELFGATAGYAAVLVVFVSGNLGGSSDCTCH